MIQIEGLWAGYGGLDILRGLDLRVADGDIACIIGPNGAGKSTVLKTISGILRPRRGSVVVGGTDLTGQPPQAVLRAGVAQVPQRHGLFGKLTVRQNVLMGAYVIRRQRTRVETRYQRLAQTFPLLAEHPGLPAGALSGGQRRMVEFARALMLEPAVVLLDEPTLGLDPASLAIIRDSITAMYQAGTTILMVEQNVRFGLSLARHAAVMSAGTVVLTGPATDIANHPDLMKIFLTERTAVPLRMNPLLDRLRRGELALMLCIRTSRTADVVRIAHATGYQAIMVDLEHSTMPLDVAALLCATATDLGLTPLVRVPERDYGMIGRLLDGGALGIVAPRTETPEQARAVVMACRFPPRGQRSQLAMVPWLGMRPTPAAQLNPVLDDATIVQILVETPTGVVNADGIAALDGVDMLAFGANDFTAELGAPGSYADPRVADAIAALAAACRRHGKLLMVGGITDRALMEKLVPSGVCPLRLAGTDTELLYAAAAARAATYLPEGAA